ncbi:MAG: ATP-binding protein [Lautropia sp.]
MVARSRFKNVLASELPGQHSLEPEWQAPAEHHRLGEAFAFSPAFVGILNGPDHRIEYFNDRFHRLVGRRELAGRPIRTALPELVRQGVVDVLDQVYHRGRPQVGSAVPLALRRGQEDRLEEIFVDCVHQPLRGPDGAVNGILVHGVDVTEQHLRQAGDRFLLALDETLGRLTQPEAIVAAGTHLLKEHLQVQSCDFLTLRADEETVDVDSLQSRQGTGGPVLRRLSELGPQAGQLLAQDQPYLAHPERSMMVVPLLKDGRIGALMVLCHASWREWRPHEVALVRQASHRCGQSLACARTAIDLAQALRSVRRARAEAELAGHLKDEFLATLSHELRTPLNAILGWAAVLKNGAAPGVDIAHGADVIERQARAQARVIDDLLDVSVIDTGKLRLNLRSLDLTRILDGAVAAVRPTARAKHIQLQLQDCAKAIGVLADADRLHQIFWNLLANAVRFTPRGGRIQVSLRQVAASVEVAVSDNGEGIDAAFLPVVFDRFRQADASTTRRHGGLGLGLSIVRKLAELHGGSVRACSAGPGRGSVFFVALPLAVFDVGGAEAAAWP